MSTSRHTILARFEKFFHAPWMPADERESANVQIEIEFSYVPGRPESGPSFSSGGEPADPAEVEFISARLIDGDGLAPSKEQVDEWAQDWLDDKGYDAACEMAAFERAPDPDAARDRAIDSRMEGLS